MHPRVFFDGFWRNDLKDEVFVAMQFGDPYDARFEQIFREAIEGEPLAGMSLKAVRVDVRRTGDSILTEINDGIAHSQLVVADISVTHRCETGGDEHAFRNGNVMYEVGLALTCRQPVEVVLVRDDNDKLLFDVSHIPVVTYHPGDVSGSVDKIRKLLIDRLQERQLIKDLRTIAALESLSPFELNIIKSNAHMEIMAWKGGGLPAAVAMGLPRLLDKKIVRKVQSKSEDHPHAYKWTTFGRAIADWVSASSSFRPVGDPTATG